MEGRTLRLWLCSGILLGSLGCHKQQTLPGGITLPSPGQPVASKSPSLFSRSPDLTKPASANPAPNQASVEPSAHKSGSKKEISPSSLVAFGDLRAEVAFAETTTPADREKQIDAARTAYQNALKKDPKQNGAMLGLARLYSRIGEVNRADEMYRQYLTLNPKDHAVMHEVAMGHARAKDFAGAATWCQQALKVDPENRGYRKTLGFCLTHAGKWDEGFAALCQVMTEAEARFTMARAFNALNKPEMGQQQLTLAIKADPSFVPAREMLAEMQPATPTPRVFEIPNEVQAVQYQQPVMAQQPQVQYQQQPQVYQQQPTP